MFITLEPSICRFLFIKLESIFACGEFNYYGGVIVFIGWKFIRFIWSKSESFRFSWGVIFTCFIELFISHWSPIWGEPITVSCLILILWGRKFIWLSPKWWMLGLVNAGEKFFWTDFLSTVWQYCFLAIWTPKIWEASTIIASIPVI